ncbi:hypothetical protein [Parabacteroides provencensis]|uniref:hypothetical protein n=1 Tax=Parabacteroides provencensis TaxID=1944636 RepID=UPI00117E3E87|nr:hypothetical protein [Parabacteroides provencensis]
MNKIVNSDFLAILNVAVHDNTLISKLDASEVFKNFQGELSAILDSEMEFAVKYRYLGSLLIEFSTLQRGIVAQNCEAGEKYYNY